MNRRLFMDLVIYTIAALLTNFLLLNVLSNGKVAFNVGQFWFAAGVGVLVGFWRKGQERIGAVLLGGVVLAATYVAAVILVPHFVR